MLVKKEITTEYFLFIIFYFECLWMERILWFKLQCTHFSYNLPTLHKYRQKYKNYYFLKCVIYLKQTRIEKKSVLNIGSRYLLYTKILNCIFLLTVFSFWDLMLACIFFKCHLKFKITRYCYFKLLFWVKIFKTMSYSVRPR